MNKADVEKIRIDIKSGQDSALSMMLCKDGTLGRKGNGQLPPEKIAVLGMTDGAVFKKLIELLDERVFSLAAIFDHPNKLGQPITYTIAFLGESPNIAVFEFRLGLETPDVGDLLPYFDKLISFVVQGTNEWYQNEKAKIQNSASTSA
jgi:hypothetical protein